MLQVKVIRTDNSGTPSEQIVTLYGFKRLTPLAARAALEMAFGVTHGGEVWTLAGSYGYRVYPHTARKVSML